MTPDGTRGAVLKLYNTRTRSVEELRPLEAGHVRMYVCGLTPSAEAHLGHARSFLFFDVLRRYLAHPRNGYRVTYVRNVTDIDDRSIRTAAQEGTTYDRVVARYKDAFDVSMLRLGALLPDLEPTATGFIPEIITMIGELIGLGNAYASSDGVYYSVETFARYGALSGKHTEELLVGARIAENEEKRDPLDFALWKFAKPGEPSWDSPWGAGRPGWHIECSAMSRSTLGVPLDVHGGGYDLVFPHHENEIAQSEPLMPAPPMAQHWVHGGLLNFEGRKMSKSLGNFEPLTALLDRVDPMAVRLLFLQTGYRKPMNFTEESIAGATTALERIVAARAHLGDGDPAPGTRERFFAALDDDMNTAGAVGVLFSEVLAGPNGRGFLDEVLEVLGLGPVRDRAPRSTTTLPADLVQRLAARLGDDLHFNGASPEDAVAAVIAARADARKNRDFAKGDRLRDALAAEGIALKDSKDGTTWTAGGA